MTDKRMKKRARRAFLEMKYEYYKKYINEKDPVLKEIFKKHYDNFVKYKDTQGPNKGYDEDFIGG